MTDEQILQALKRLRVETGSLACLGCGREHNCGTQGCAILRKAADLIERLSGEVEALREKVPQWISVEERMPNTIPCNAGTEYSEAVIVWTTGNKAMIAVWDGIDFICPTDFWEAWGEEITHWMPLPEAPGG